jgi:nicotinamidase-related amidase
MSIEFTPSGTVEIPEIPYKDEVRLPASKTALLITDMQNGFVKPEGSLTVPVAAETVPGIRRLLEAARAADLHIGYTQDSHVPEDPEFEVWSSHCEIGTWDWELIDELKPRPDDMIFQKNRYDAFYGTWLEHFLSYVWRVEHLVIAGTISNICVLHTAASAGIRYFHIVVPADGISALTDFDQAMTLRQASWLYRGTVVRSTDDIHFEA